MNDAGGSGASGGGVSSGGGGGCAAGGSNLGGAGDATTSDAMNEAGVPPDAIGPLADAGDSRAPTEAGDSAGGGFTYDPIKGTKFDEMPLYAGAPPNFKAGAPAETLNANGGIGNVSVPTLRRYAMDGSKATGFGYLVFPGGGYTMLDMETHAGKLAERLGPLGIAVFSLKYRVGSGTNDAPGDALIDAKRAVRTVKQNATHWAVDSAHLGVIGYSAGSHVALNLAANFDTGNAGAADPIEKQSSRPAFIGSMSTWSFGASTSPFTFPAGVPPTYFCHAQDDTIAPIALPKAVEAQIRAKGAATVLDFYATGGHYTCHPGDLSMPGHDWPNKFWPWVQTVVP
ncbi:MAG TPA: alpha/beta hydrolase [Polyangiaceae bacterium]|nr:alpha/beta hydrolase [Polyangiaceae bacterium]